MKEMIEKIKEVLEDVKDGFGIYLLARRYSRKQRDLSQKSLRAVYEKN
ncbi:MAG: hypothetical protein V2A72_01730 [Candidatus Omnitrophota bacterium]